MKAWTINNDQEIICKGKTLIEVAEKCEKLGYKTDDIIFVPILDPNVKYIFVN